MDAASVLWLTVLEYKMCPIFIMCYILLQLLYYMAVSPTVGFLKEDVSSRKSFRYCEQSVNKCLLSFSHGAVDHCVSLCNHLPALHLTTL